MATSKREGASLVTLDTLGIAKAAFPEDGERLQAFADLLQAQAKQADDDSVLNALASMGYMSVDG